MSEEERIHVSSRLPKSLVKFVEKIDSDNRNDGFIKALQIAQDAMDKGIVTTKELEIPHESSAPKPDVLSEHKKLTPREKAEMMLDIWQRKREIDVNAKAELAERLQKIKEKYRPIRNSAFNLGNSEHIEPQWDNGL